MGGKNGKVFGDGAGLLECLIWLERNVRHFDGLESPLHRFINDSLVSIFFKFRVKGM